MTTSLHCILTLAVATFILVTLACVPQIVFAYSQIPKPPLTKPTDDRLYSITISWEPDPVKPYPNYNVTTTFFIEIADRFGEPAANRAYSVTVKGSDPNFTIIKEFNNEMTDDKGRSAPFNIEFPESGPSIVTVCVPAEPSSNRISCAGFNIIVIPEFPATHAILVMSGTIGISILLMRKIRLKP